MKKFVVIAGGTLLALYGTKKLVEFVWVKEGVATYDYINQTHAIDPATAKMALKRMADDILANGERHRNIIRTNHKAVRTHLVDEYLGHVAMVRAEQKRNFRTPADELLREFSDKLKDSSVSMEEVKDFITTHFGISAKDQHRIDEAYSKLRKNHDG